MRSRPSGAAPTLKDVARASGVSVTTASRVLNGDERVVADLRDRVRRAAKNLGYAANAAARSLRGASNMVALLADDAASESLTEIAWAVEDAAKQAGALATTSAAGGDPNRQLAALRLLCSLRPRALILTGGWLGAPEIHEDVIAVLRSYATVGGRVVTIGKPLERYSSVGFNDVQAGMDVGAHLAASGRKSALIISGRRGHHAYEDRTRGFMEALTYAAIDDIRVRYCPVLRGAAEEVTAATLTERSSGMVLCGNDRLAFGAMAAIERLGLRIPEDVLLAGVDDMKHAGEVTPPLTSVALPFPIAGREALRLALADDREPQNILLEGTLVVRGSSRSSTP